MRRFVLLIERFDVVGLMNGVSEHQVSDDELINDVT